jgi:DNA repair exonuclease SbcCD ATPase subunit
MNDLTNYRKYADEMMVMYKTARSGALFEAEALEKAIVHASFVEEAQQIVQGVAQSVQQQVHQHIATVVTRCLEAVFEDPYSFRIEFERKRGRTEARLIFTRDGLDVDPTKAAGGGVCDLAAFALRLACLMLSRPPARSLLVLDEPFKHLSSNHTNRITKLLEVLAKEMKVQFILITHNDQLQVGKVIEL